MAEQQAPMMPQEQAEGEGGGAGDVSAQLQELASLGDKGIQNMAEVLQAAGAPQAAQAMVQLQQSYRDILKSAMAEGGGEAPSQAGQPAGNAAMGANKGAIPMAPGQG